VLEPLSGELGLGSVELGRGWICRQIWASISTRSSVNSSPGRSFHRRLSGQRQPWLELAAAIESTPERWKLALLLAAWCQLRQGEILGLQRRDVDPLHGIIAIDRTWTAVSKSSPVIGPPKTDAGRRRVAVPPNVAGPLKLHLSKHVGAAPDSWIFPGEGDNPASPRTLNHVWSKARDNAGRPDLRLHDLRHSGLTWAAATGASTAELMRRAGHSSAQAALRYQHATEDRDRVLADALGTLATASKIDLIKPDTDTLRTAPPDTAKA
jgi:integrase